MILYHGSADDFAAFDFAKCNTPLSRPWFTENIEVAKTYPPFLYQADVLIHKPFVIDIAHYAKITREAVPDWRDNLIANGYDGIYIDNNGTYYFIPFSNKQIQDLKKLK